MSYKMKSMSEYALHQILLGGHISKMMQ